MKKIIFSLEVYPFGVYEINRAGACALTFILIDEQGASALLNNVIDLNKLSNYTFAETVNSGEASETPYSLNVIGGRVLLIRKFYSNEK